MGEIGSKAEWRQGIQFSQYIHELKRDDEKMNECFTWL